MSCGVTHTTRFSRPRRRTGSGVPVKIASRHPARSSRHVLLDMKPQVGVAAHGPPEKR